MRKVKVLLVIMLIFLMQGCGLDDPKYINFKNKPSNNYYTQEIKKKLLNKEDYSLLIFNTDLYKNIDVSDDEKIIIENLVSSLTSNNYKDSLELPNKEPYQLKITFEDSTKFMIRIYDNNSITISPWDGIFEEDFITIEDVPQRYNLYDFCKYIDNSDLK